jgi:hypothetical protein
MTRKSKREIESDLDDLDDEEDDTLRVVIQHNLVDEDGEVVETNERVVEL